MVGVSTISPDMVTGLWEVMLTGGIIDQPGDGGSVGSSTDLSGNGVTDGIIDLQKGLVIVGIIDQPRNGVTEVIIDLQRNGVTEGIIDLQRNGASVVITENSQVSGVLITGDEG